MNKKQRAVIRGGRYKVGVEDTSTATCFFLWHFMGMRLRILALERLKHEIPKENSNV